MKTSHALAVLLASSLIACQAQVPAAPVPGAAPGSAPAPAAATAASPDAQARLLDRIRAEIGSAACSSHAQCRSLAVGAKACGGPAAWWAWSSSHADEERLQAWAQELATLQRQANERSGLVSNCAYVPDPGASCVAQRCVLNTRSGLR